MAILSMVFVTVVIVWKVLSSEKVTVETLYGAVSAYRSSLSPGGMTYSLADLFGTPMTPRNI